MAGTSPTFDATEFRTAIRNTMIMGLPGAVADYPTFRWKANKTYVTADQVGDPYDLSATPQAVVQKPDLQLPCAITFTARPTASQMTNYGEMDAPRVVLTMLDTDYDQIAGANEVLLGGNTYDILFTAPPNALFDVTVYSVYLQAQDES